LPSLRRSWPSQLPLSFLGADSSIKDPSFTSAPSIFPRLWFVHQGSLVYFRSLFLSPGLIHPSRIPCLL
jgi:hypothetical protein